MPSPVSFDKPFTLSDVPLKQFHPLGTQLGNKGITHTVFLSKKLMVNEFRAQAVESINGFCSYAFLENSGMICGVVIMSPTHSTSIRNSAVVVGSESEKYRPVYHLQPQGIIIMESDDSNTVFVSLEVDSPLMVKVDV